MKTLFNKTIDTIILLSFFLPGSAQNVNELLKEAVKNLQDPSQVSYSFELTSPSKGLIASGDIWLTPQKESETYGFDNMMLTSTNEMGLKQEIIMNEGIVYVKNHGQHWIFSSINRLGLPLYATSIGLQHLLFQYLPVLKDAENYNPKAGRTVHTNTGISQEIIFDIKEYDFYAAFLIDTSTSIVQKITSKQSNGLYDYEIRNFKKSGIKLPAMLGDQKNASEFFGSLPPIGTLAPLTDLPFIITKDSFKIDQLNGKIVVLDFWATWCEPCLKSLPKMDSLSKLFDSKQVQFLAITHDEKGKPESIIKRMSLSQTFLEGNVMLSKSFGLFDIGIPTVFLMDKRGKIVDFESGFQGDASISRLYGKINALLAGKDVGVGP